MTPDIKIALAQPRTVALYMSISDSNYLTVMDIHYVNYGEDYQPLPEGQRREIPSSHYVRITEPVEIRFTAISDDAVVQNAIASLNEEERKAIAELNQKVTAIRERKAQLLALTYQSEVSHG